MKDRVVCEDCRAFQYPAWFIFAAPALVWHLMREHMKECAG
jgi:hypothetical protein